MRAAAAIFLAALSTACLDPDVPSYTLSPVTPTAQVPTILAIAAAPGIGATAKQAFVTATLKDQDRRGIGQVMLSFATSKGTIEPPQAMTNVNGEVRATLTSGTDATVTVVGAGLQASTDVAIEAPLTVTLSVPPAEKNVPVKMTATVASSDAAPPLSFAWEFGDGQTATTDSGQVTHQYRDDGPVTVRVTVTDALERKGSISTSVFVLDNPEPPPVEKPPAPSISVTVSANPSQPVAGQATTLTATATPQSGAPPVTSFEWDCASDGTTDAITPGNTFACTYAAAGTRTARVIAHAGAVSGEGTVSITILADAPLMVSVTANPLAGIQIGTPVTFNAIVTVLTGMVPTALRWEWDENGDGTYDFVDPSKDSPYTRTLMFGTAGAHTVKVRTTHPASGREAIGTIAITVQP